MMNDPVKKMGRPCGAQSSHTAGLRQIIRMGYDAGLTQGEIAVRVNLERASVAYHTRAMGLKYPMGYPAQRRARDGAAAQ